MDTPGLALRSRGEYVRVLRPHLPDELFRPARRRLALIPLYLAMVVGGTVALAAGWLAWPFAIATSLAIGFAFSALTFIAHEAMHGSIVRSRGARYAVTWLGMLPYAVSPRLWHAWHDRVHHGGANHPADDPDAYPTLAEYHAKRRVRVFVNWFSLGGRRWRGLLCLAFGFTGQGLVTLFTAGSRGVLPKREHRLAIAETAVAVAVWGVVAFVIGFVPFLLAVVVPMVITNIIVMAFILTNHTLSPLAEINDPLVTGLSVTNPGWIERATLNFGFHVEHHLFPSLSSRHAPRVRALILERWPERYQSMSLREALGRLHRTARVYKDATTLVDPKTGAEFPTLVPGVAGATARPAASSS